MKFELKPYHRNISKDDLLADIQHVADKLGKKTLSADEYSKHGKYHPATIIRKIGGWNRALSEAGIELLKRHGITDEELLQNIEEVWTKIGRQPYYSDMQVPLSKYPGRTYLNRFKQWRKALERFVAYINNEAKISSEDALSNLPVESVTRHKTSRAINWRLRFMVMRRDNFKCKSCGKSPATDPNIILHVDHIKAWSNGGETVLENLQTLCLQCNIGKSNLE